MYVRVVQIQEISLFVKMAKELDCDIVVSELKLQSRYYVHFQTNTLAKGMNPHILPVMD